MTSHSARKAARDEGFLVFDVDQPGVSVVGLALYVGPDATDDQFKEVVDSQAVVMGLRERNEDRRANSARFTGTSVR